MSNYGVGAMAAPVHEIAVYFSDVSAPYDPPLLSARVSTVVTCDYCTNECNYRVARLSEKFDTDIVKTFVKASGRDRAGEKALIAAVVDPFLRERGLAVTRWEYESYSSDGGPGNGWYARRDGWYAEAATCPQCPGRHSCGV